MIWVNAACCVCVTWDKRILTAYQNVYVIYLLEYIKIIFISDFGNEKNKKMLKKIIFAVIKNIFYLF